MWQPLLLVLPLLTTSAIKVAVDKEQIEPQNITSDVDKRTQSQIEYSPSEKVTVDSYLIPPDPHIPEEVLPDSVVTPATHLLPPSIEQQTNYYYEPTINLPEANEQTDWYPLPQPINQNRPVKLLPIKQHSLPIFFSRGNQSRPFIFIQNARVGKTFGAPIPSIQLEPPSANAPNDYINTVPSKQLELPTEETHKQNLRPTGESQPHNVYVKDVKPYRSTEPSTVLPFLIPPKPQMRKYLNPTKLFPKKYVADFQPIPIPLAKYEENSSEELPKAVPVQYFKPAGSQEDEEPIPYDEKKIHQFEENQQKRKFRKQSQINQEQVQLPVGNHNQSPTEQDASESNYGYPRPQVYGAPVYGAAVPLKQRPTPTPQKNQQSPPAPDDRTEFRMHGMNGPHSYQFGYDTGKGKNRQFRYEERDNDGYVRGHYGYVDKHGKMRVTKYRAHPELGFQAEPELETKET